MEIKIARLSKNSSNSSKRPSSDDIIKPKTKKKDRNRTIGGQPDSFKKALEEAKKNIMAVAIAPLNY